MAERMRVKVTGGAYLGMTGTVDDIENPRRGPTRYHVVFDKPRHPDFKGAYLHAEQVQIIKSEPEAAK